MSYMFFILSIVNFFSWNDAWNTDNKNERFHTIYNVIDTVDVTLDKRS